MAYASAMEKAALNATSVSGTLGHLAEKRKHPIARRSGSAAGDVREIRAVTKLSQAKFAAVLQVDVGTVRNWEQGKRQPSGPAKALLRAIHADPQNVLRALQAPA
jgi:DNA-binding transcriptional regulator YiaG